MRRSIEAGKKADYYADKAQSIKDNDAIFSDDPQALLKLEQKLGALKDRQDFMRAANKCLRKKDRKGFLELNFGTSELWEKLINPELGWVGFAAYSLSNNNANIRCIEKRIAALKAQSVSTYMTDTIDFELSEADPNLTDEELQNHKDIIIEWTYQLGLLANTIEN